MISLWNPYTISRPRSRSPRVLDEWSTFFDNLSPSIDYQENENNTITYFFDVPGCKIEDINISVEGNIVSIDAQRNGRNRKYSFKSSFTIPETYDIEPIEAKLEDGVLHLELRKKEKLEKQIKKIEIKKIDK